MQFHMRRHISESSMKTPVIAICKCPIIYIYTPTHTSSSYKGRKMYATRRLSELQKSAELFAAPPDGPNSGYLVIQDDESVTYSCFGCCKNYFLDHLPFPQDKELTVSYTIGINTGESKTTYTYTDPLFFIPLLNHPLSSNRYYAIQPHGKRIGEAFTCSTEEDKTTCCFCRCIKELKPRPLDPNNIYQQFEIVPYQVGCRAGGKFLAKSTASDGFPPDFLRRKGWTINTMVTPDDFKLDDAPGLDSPLRARLPLLDSPAPTLVGKWYTPFIFVKERTLREQVKQSMYYEVTLEQRWEQIFRCGKSVGNSVAIDTSVETEQVFVGGSKASWKEQSAVDGVVWYKVDGGGGVGLRVELVKRMKWEQKRGGWMEGGGGEEEREVKIKKVEEYWKEGGIWNELRCYVLVETFNVRRLDGSLVMSYHFKYFHNLKTIWD